MYDSDVRKRALGLIEQGISLRATSKSTGVSRATLRDWCDHPEKTGLRASCPRCAPWPWLPEPRRDYTYLLGLYLGDGCISVGGNPAKGVWALRIACADAWPGLRAECIAAMRAIRPGNEVSTRQNQGCTEVISYSRHWPCLFPQHGPGEKHKRTIELARWQQQIVTERPGDFRPGPVPLRRLPIHLAGPSTAVGRRPTGTSTRGTCSPMNHVTFSGCAGRPSISSGSAGGSPAATPSRWRAGRRWRGWMSLSGRSTEPRRGPTAVSAGRGGGGPAGRRSGRGTPRPRPGRSCAWPSSRPAGWSRSARPS